VIEKYLPLDQQFIPNDLSLNGELKIENLPAGRQG
jgi:hypothetical protein